MLKIISSSGYVNSVSVFASTVKGIHTSFSIPYIIHHCRSELCNFYFFRFLPCVCVQLPGCVQFFDPVVCSLPGSSVSTEVGCHFLLHKIFPTQGSNLCLLQPLNWQADSFTTEPPEKRSPPSSGMPITLLLPFLIGLDSSYIISSFKKNLRSLSSPTYIIIKFLSF